MISDLSLPAYIEIVTYIKSVSVFYFYWVSDENHFSHRYVEANWIIICKAPFHCERRLPYVDFKLWDFQCDTQFVWILFFVCLFWRAKRADLEDHRLSADHGFRNAVLDNLVNIVPSVMMTHENIEIFLIDQGQWMSQLRGRIHRKVQHCVVYRVFSLVSFLKKKDL